MDELKTASGTTGVEQAVRFAPGARLPSGRSLDRFDPIAGLFAGTAHAASAFAAGAELLDSISMAAAALGGLDATLSPTPASSDVLAALARSIASARALDLTDPATATTFIGASARAAEGSVPRAFDSLSTIDNIVSLYTGTALSQAVAAATSMTPCFCPGTLILTPDGERPVETLEIGDFVVTVAGRIEPIRWIGRRSYAEAFVVNRRDILPVCVKAGALADGVPRRDLWLSPSHALLVGQPGVLVPVGALVNGRSIVQPKAVGSVRYLHIELLRHDVIVADGAPAETFVDDGGRGVFHNAESYAALYGASDVAQAVYCARWLDHGPVVDEIWRALAHRVSAGSSWVEPGTIHGFLDAAIRTATQWEISGWARYPDFPERPVCVDLLVSGSLLTRAVANAFRADLKQAGIGDGCHGFHITLPPTLSLDRRSVQVSCSLTGVPLPPSDAYQRCLAAH